VGINEAGYTKSPRRERGPTAPEPFSAGNDAERGDIHTRKEPRTPAAAEAAKRYIPTCQRGRSIEQIKRGGEKDRERENNENEKHESNSCREWELVGKDGAEGYKKNRKLQQRRRKVLEVSSFCLFFATTRAQGGRGTQGLKA